MRFFDWLFGLEQESLYVVETPFARMWNVSEKILPMALATSDEYYQPKYRLMTPEEIREHH